MSACKRRAAQTEWPDTAPAAGISVINLIWSTNVSLTSKHSNYWSPYTHVTEAPTFTDGLEWEKSEKLLCRSLSQNHGGLYAHTTTKRTNRSTTRGVQSDDLIDFNAGSCLLLVESIRAEEISFSANAVQLREALQLGQIDLSTNVNQFGELGRAKEKGKNHLASKAAEHMGFNECLEGLNATMQEGSEADKQSPPEPTSSRLETSVKRSQSGICGALSVVKASATEMVICLMIHNCTATHSSHHGIYTMHLQKAKVRKKQCPSTSTTNYNTAAQAWQ